MAPQAIDLFIGHMCCMDKLDIAVLLGPVDMAEKAFLLRSDPFAPCNGEMALLALKSGLENVIVGKALSRDGYRFVRRCMAGRTTRKSLIMGNAFKMTEITDLHGNLHVLTLENVGMAAPTVQLNA